MVRLPFLIAIAAATPLGASWAQSVPDALSVEWQGKKPCEKLFEDAQIRIARCTFPPGSVHVRHSHPGYFAYTLSGGKGQIEDEKGVRQIDAQVDGYANSAPVAWHELTNTGDTTLRFLVIERKYEPPPSTAAEGSSGK